ncbi:MAG: NAD(+) synthase [Acetobacter fabarum]|uniref:NAD(+) synthase n=1 Tax=Acetobacter fabarum TaxID=483199 RepID=UPI00242DB7D0|nr:NAD(+) synthase [Acetobacter fabarum]MCH4025363.1 NAD(+) synthase [Acetobacter fabarum]MCH4128030.1 NAD(+) synthase [Acetobacter fabarum]MCH4141310.1 NAD(+) synthase [Acetobacter fabarum]MCI1297355.1 NAD(+) synthase [Acetobacter fabarum]MCI1322257.1 NAD(+) synthase [Acetobacter fabarum]
MTTSLFRSLYHQGFVRVAACTAPVTLADPYANKDQILATARTCAQQGAGLCVFPELGLSGYSIEDLLQHSTLQRGVENALVELAQATVDLLPVLVVGAPLAHRNSLYNCAVVLHRDRILGVVPKSYLPNYREFYEKRHFAPGAAVRGQSMRLGGQDVPFGVDLLFTAQDVPGFCLGVEICEDMWVPNPPSTAQAMAGATVLANLSASDITVGKARTRSLLCLSQSARCVAAYLYAAAGEGESTTDLAWDGQTAIFENGVLLAESERFPTGAQAVVADIDLTLLRHERAQVGSFADCAAMAGPAQALWRSIGFTLAPPVSDLGLLRPLSRFPFVPADPARLEQDCFEAFTIQVSALKQRLKSCRAAGMVIGVSGGLDSTHALLVAVRTADELGWPRTAIRGYTMPGFGTTEQTLASAHALMEHLGITQATLDIRPAATLMLQTMDHPFARGEPVHDITFENVQAGLRTDFLFRLANQHNGIVIGTGDLSELALGWCTYGVGDQMAHYNVNAGLPKTLIQHLIRWCIASGHFPADVCAVLRTVLATEISPELIPATAGASQSTEDTIGPYALHDFTLYYVLRHGFGPARIAFMAEQVWRDAGQGAWPPGFMPHDHKSYGLPVIRKWLKVFMFRFFTTSQFKRSAMPNGPKVMAGGSLSPRGDWRAPSDGNATLWLKELEEHVPEA